jgi:hypothetical protein
VVFTASIAAGCSRTGDTAGNSSFSVASRVGVGTGSGETRTLTWASPETGFGGKSSDAGTEGCDAVVAEE